MTELRRVLSCQVASRASGNAVLPSRSPSLALNLSRVSCSGALFSKEEPENPLALLLFPAGNYTELVFVGKRVSGSEAQSAS